MKNPPSRHGRRTSRRARWAPISTPSLIKNLRVDRVRAQGTGPAEDGPGGFNQGGETSESTKAEKPCGTRGHDLLRPKSLSPPSLRPVLAPSSSPPLAPDSRPSQPSVRAPSDPGHPTGVPPGRPPGVPRGPAPECRSPGGAERRVAESSGLGAGSGERG